MAGIEPQLIADICVMAKAERINRPLAKWCLQLNTLENGQRSYHSHHYVADKKEARVIAARHNAQPWNF